MNYQMLYKRQYNDHENPFIYVETFPNGAIVEEPWDNGLNRRVTFTGIDIQYRKKGENKSHTHYHVSDHEYSLYVTDSRLIFKLNSMKTELKFNGSLINLGIDALFKKYEDKQVEGLQIIGQLRYEWLGEVMYYQKINWKYDNKLRFTYFDSNVTKWTITITFANDMDVRFLANEILHLACRYKEQTRFEKDQKLSSFISAYKTDMIPPAADPKKQFASIAFPNTRTACSGKDERPLTDRYLYQ